MRQKLRLALLPLIVLAAALFVVSPAVAAKPTVVGHINAGGTSVMTDLPAGMGVTSFSFHATLYSDGTATGHVDCVDHVGDVPGYPGNIFGAITGWSQNADGTVNLEITDGKLVNFPASGGGGLVVPGGLPFTVTIQSPGGPGVGHWTLDVPGVVSPFNGGPICQELMVSGQIKINWT